MATCKKKRNYYCLEPTKHRITPSKQRDYLRNSTTAHAVVILAIKLQPMTKLHNVSFSNKQKLPAWRYITVYNPIIRTRAQSEDFLAGFVIAISAIGVCPELRVRSQVPIASVMDIDINPINKAAFCQNGTVSKSRNDSKTTESRYETQPMPNLAIGSERRKLCEAAQDGASSSRKALA